MVYREMSEEKEIQACAICKGPFEFWGTSRGFSLYRCQVCKLIHFVEMGQLASFKPGAAEHEKARVDRNDRALLGHRITLRDAGEPPIHAFIGTAGEDESPVFGEPYEESEEREANSEREEETVPFSGYKKYK